MRASAADEFADRLPRAVQKSAGCSAAIRSTAEHPVRGSVAYRARLVPAGNPVRFSLEFGITDGSEQVLSVLRVLAEVSKEWRRGTHVAKLQRAEAAKVELAPVRIEPARALGRHSAATARRTRAGRLTQGDVGLEE